MSDHEPELNEPDQRKTLRRQEDRDRCNMCSFIWAAHDKDKDEHRELVCAKIGKLEISHSTDIKEVRSDMKGMVPWKAFAALITLLMALSVGLNAMIGSSVKEGQIQLRHDLDVRQDEVKRSLESIHRRISTSDDQQQQGMQLVNEKLSKIENSAGVMEWRLGQVERRLGIVQGAK